MEKMKVFDKMFRQITGLFIFVIFIICSLPFILTQNSDSFDFKDTGEIGDTIGGTMTPFIGIAAAFLTFLAFWIQKKANDQQRADFTTQLKKNNLDAFETKFFELIRLHRDNISELNYSKSDGTISHKSINRKVFRVIFQEFIECYREVTKFSRFTAIGNILNPKYKERLESIIIRKNLKCDIRELVVIDIAYSIVFYGVGIEGLSVLRDRFKSRYQGEYYYRLLSFIRLKPKKELREDFEMWESLRTEETKYLKQLIDEIYEFRYSKILPQTLNNKSRQILIRNYDFEKYYGGHQHRLGHYFRHLYQSYKFLRSNVDLDPYQEDFYSRTLRSQMSTYEQALLVVNSISSLGMNWEYTLTSEDPQNVKENGLITKYNIIKNLPGNHIFGITYRKYYPNVKFESREEDNVEEEL